MQTHTESLKLPKIFMPELPDKSPLTIDDEEQILTTAKAGDVLMSASTIEREPYGYLSWLVRKLDQGWYSHTAFFDGDDVIESGPGQGIRKTKLTHVVKRNRYTDVYRFQSDECRLEGKTSANCQSIGNDGFPAQPLKQTAHNFIGKKYATADAILAGLIMLRQRKLTTSHAGARLIRAALRVAIIRLRIEQRENPNAAALTCSELVYRIFYEADPERKYRLIISEKHDPDSYFHAGTFSIEAENPTIEIPVETILSADSPQNGAGLLTGCPRDVQELANDLRQFAKLVSPMLQQGGRQALTARGDIDIPDQLSLVHDANFISPADVCNSGNLQEIGRLKKI